jgi:gamma-glutamylcyclotransferase (GGCT)/AIG2-like uncharacterized protein YtfP
MISIFVYGTLKQGYCNHERFCKTAVSIKPAWVWGRLYHLPAGYPGLEIPDTSILSPGTMNPLADERVQNSTLVPIAAMNKPEGDWDKIQGELITFAKPELNLPPIDRLEGFNLGGWCLYERVLVAADVGGVSLPIWIYDYKQEFSAARVYSGSWFI